MGLGFQELIDFLSNQEPVKPRVKTDKPQSRSPYGELVGGSVRRRERKPANPNAKPLSVNKLTTGTLVYYKGWTEFYADWKC